MSGRKQHYIPSWNMAKLFGVDALFVQACPAQARGGEGHFVEKGLPDFGHRFQASQNNGLLLHSVKSRIMFKQK